MPITDVPANHVVVRNLYLSIDAAMRIWISGVKSYTDPVKPGEAMKGMGVAKVIYSNSEKWKAGDIVLAVTKWQKYTVINAKELTKLPNEYPSYSDFLGVLGISGLTAYFGLHKIGKIQKG